MRASSRPGTAMTGIFSEADSQISRPRTAESNVIEESNDRHSVGEEENTDDESSDNEDSASKHDSRDDEANGAEKVNEDSNADDDAAESVVTEDINASIDKVVIDELANEDEESVASSISTRSYDDKYRDPDWGTWTSPEGAKWEGYLVDNNFDPKGHDGHSGITGRFFTVDKYNETFDGDLYERNPARQRACIDLMMGQLILATGSMGRNTGRVVWKWPVGKYMTANGKMTKCMDMEFICFPMGLHLKVSTLTVSGRDTEIMSVLMEKYTTAVFGQTNGMGLDEWYMQTMEDTKANFMKINAMEKARFMSHFIQMKNQECVLPNRTPTWYRDREEFKETYIGTWVNDRMDGTSLYLVDQPTGFVLKRKGFWERGVRMKWVYTFPYQEATDYFCNLLKDPQMYRQAYGMSVVQKNFHTCRMELTHKIVALSL